MSMLFLCLNFLWACKLKLVLEQKIVSELYKIGHKQIVKQGPQTQIDRRATFQR